MYPGTNHAAVFEKERLENQNHGPVKMEKTPNTLQDKVIGAQNFRAFFWLEANIFL